MTFATLAVAAVAAAPLPPVEPAPAAVVTVHCDGARRDTRSGGFFVSPDGLVATVLHGVTGSTPDDLPLRIRVGLADGRWFSVDRIEASDPASDLCLLRLPIASPDWLRLGEPAGTGDEVTVLADRAGRRAPLRARVAGPRRGEAGEWRLRLDQALTRRSGSAAIDAAGDVVGMVSTTHELIASEAIRGLLDRREPRTPVQAHNALAETPWGLLDFAADSLRRGRLEESLWLLDRAAGTPPALGAVHHLRGVVLARLGDLDAARRAYDAALAIRPDMGASRHNLRLLRERAAASAASLDPIERPPDAVPALAAAASPEMPEEEGGRLWVAVPPPSSTGPWAVGSLLALAALVALSVGLAGRRWAFRRRFRDGAR
jgi:hypothetical protein